MAEVQRSAVVLGAGGHAKVLIDALRRAKGIDPRAALDRDRSRVGERVLGVPIVGDDAALDGFDRRRVVLVNGVGSVQDTTARRAVFERGRRLGFSFAMVVHPSACIGGGVALAEGVQVLAGAIVNAEARIDVDAIINTGAIIEHDCRVGAHVHVATGAVIAGGVTLDDGVHVGAGATVIQGVHVGPGAVIGAGAAVIADVAAGDVVVGVPARRVARK